MEITPSNSQEPTAPEQRTQEQEILELVKNLSYKEMNQIRGNITLNKEAPSMTYHEQRSIRLTCKGPLVPVSTGSEEQKEAAVPFMHVYNMFQHGTLKSFANHIQGILWIGWNTYQVGIRTTETAKILCTRYDVESTARGATDEEIFQFRFDDFRGSSRNLTFYPLPFEFSDNELKEIVEEVLKIGTFENASWGRHRDTSWRNGFCHIRIRDAPEEIPDRVFINKRCVTILQENQKLTRRPCRLCQMRTHEMDECPSYFHFEKFVKDKIQNDEDERLAKEIQEEEDEQSRLKEQQEVAKRMDNSRNLEFSPLSDSTEDSNLRASSPITFDQLNPNNKAIPSDTRSLDEDNVSTSATLLGVDVDAVATQLKQYATASNKTKPKNTKASRANYPKRDSNTKEKDKTEKKKRATSPLQGLTSKIFRKDSFLEGGRGSSTSKDDKPA